MHEWEGVFRVRVAGVELTTLVCFSAFFAALPLLALIAVQWWSPWAAAHALGATPLRPVSHCTCRVVSLPAGPLLLLQLLLVGFLCSELLGSNLLCSLSLVGQSCVSELVPVRCSASRVGPFVCGSVCVCWPFNLCEVISVISLLVRRRIAIQLKNATKCKCKRKRLTHHLHLRFCDFPALVWPIESVEWNQKRAATIKR